MIRNTKTIFKDATSTTATVFTDTLFTVVNAGTVVIEFTGTAAFSATISVLTNFQGYTNGTDVNASATWTTVPAINMSNFNIVNSITSNGLYSIDGGIAAFKIIVSTLSGGSLTAVYSEVY